MFVITNVSCCAITQDLVTCQRDMDDDVVYGNSEGTKRQNCTLGKVPLVFWLDCIREKFPLGLTSVGHFQVLMFPLVSQYVFMVRPL